MTERVPRGERIARIFRRAGHALARGRAGEAQRILEEGERDARAEGDEVLAGRFQEEIRRVRETPPDPGPSR